MDTTLEKKDWENISRLPNLDYDFIRENKNNLEWSYLCIYQKLSEEFLREFHDILLRNSMSIS